MRDIRDQDYWKEYDGLQYAKHRILRKYLQAWFGILAAKRGVALYIDSHAGRGRHASGEPGSPLIAIECAAEHLKAGRLQDAELRFVFLEAQVNAKKALQCELDALGRMPPQINVSVIASDYENGVEQILEEMAGPGGRRAPLFAFVDPFGFSLSMRLLNRVLSWPSSEILVNLMASYANLSICRQEPQTVLLDDLFGTQSWRTITQIASHEDRNEAILDLFAGQLHADYVSTLRMLGKDNRTKYYLLHATSHPLGRDKFKEAVWSAGLGETWCASERHTPGQLTLLTGNPDLSPLRGSLLSDFDGTTVRYVSLLQWLRPKTYLEKHLRGVLVDLELTQTITVVRKRGRSAFNADLNPLITFR